MNSRNNILQSIADAGYPEVAKPKQYLHSIDYHNIVHSFVEVCRRIGSDMIIVNSHDQAMNCFLRMKDSFSANHVDEKMEKESIDILLIESRLAVAENGAVWLDETEMTQRSAPFACEHLCVIIDVKNIVANMHEAYFRLKTIYPLCTYPGFGVFIAGPSKTADIEQTLVIGAQGAKKHTIILITS